jgi:hypothetical protein
VKEILMVQDPNRVHYKWSEGVISAVTAGIFLILAGTIFLSTPNLSDKVVAFFNDFTTVHFPNTSNVFLPVPASPTTHLAIYMAVGEFSLFWGIAQFLVLALRLVFHSPIHRKAETVSGIVYWLGISYLVNLFLNAQVTVIGWFTFWSMLIVLAGITLIIRAVILAIFSK